MMGRRDYWSAIQTKRIKFIIEGMARFFAKKPTAMPRAASLNLRADSGAGILGI
jgi:hypothetical protein